METPYFWVAVDAETGLQCNSGIVYALNIDIAFDKARASTDRTDIITTLQAN